MPFQTTWLLDLHPDFPSSAQLLERLPQALVVTRQDALMGRWPQAEGPLVGYGTMATMSRLAAHGPLGHAVFDDFSRLKCSSYYRWVYDLLGRVTVIVPFSALSQLPLERLFGSRLFLRSDSNFKLFPAEVHEVSDLPGWLDLYQAYRNELVVLSEPVEIQQEYRCFCRDGRYICGSSYPEPPFHSVPTQVVKFAEQAAQRLLEQGLTMCTIDIAVGDQLRLIEAGGVNSWGLYGSSLDDFIIAMESEAYRVYEETIL